MAIQLHADRRAIEEARKQAETDKKLAIARMIVGPITNALSQFGAQAAVKYLPPSEWEEMKAGEPHGVISPGSFAPDTAAIEAQRAKTEAQPTPAAAILRPPSPPAEPVKPAGPEVLTRPAADFGEGPGRALPLHLADDPMPPTPRRVPVAEERPTHAKRPIGAEYEEPLARRQRRLPEGVAMERQAPTALARKLKAMTGDEAAKFLSGELSEEESPFYQVKEGREGHVRRAKAVRAGLEHKRGLEKSRFMLDQQKLIEDMRTKAITRQTYVNKMLDLKRKARDESDPDRLMKGGSGYAMNSPNGAWIVSIRQARQMGRLGEATPLSSAQQAARGQGDDVLVEIPYNRSERQRILSRNARVNARKMAQATKRDRVYRPVTAKLGSDLISDSTVAAFLQSEGAGQLSSAARQALEKFTSPDHKIRERIAAFNNAAKDDGLALLSEWLGGKRAGRIEKERAVASGVTTEAGRETTKIDRVNRRKDDLVAKYDKRKQEQIKAIEDKWQDDETTVENLVGGKEWASVPGVTKARILKIFGNKKPGYKDTISAEDWWKHTKRESLRNEFWRKGKKINEEIKTIKKPGDRPRPLTKDSFVKADRPGGRPVGGPPTRTAMPQGGTRQEVAVAPAKVLTPGRAQKAGEQFVAGFNRINALDEPASAKRRKVIDLANRLGVA